MAKSNLRMMLYRLLLQSRAHRSVARKGFTLIEVLVSLVIAGIVVSGLLFVVVELLRVDQREVALDQVQSDMQRAIDYITDDLQEAIYVYEDPTVVTSQLVNLNNEITTNGAVPVLAFWRTDEIDPEIIENNLPDPCGTDATCAVIKARRVSYTLVAYYQRPQYGAWEGDSTIKRYELAQYADLTVAGAAKYALTPGFRAPLNANGSLNDFVNWTASSPTEDDGTRTVLVDYVEDIRNTTNDSANPVVNCQALTGDATHVLSPPDATRNTGFFACVRPPVVTDGFRSNQEAFIFLRGDATAASDFLQPASEGSRLPVLQTQVKLGGVIEKEG